MNSERLHGAAKGRVDAPTPARHSPRPQSASGPESAVSHAQRKQTASRLAEFPLMLRHDESGLLFLGPATACMRRGRRIGYHAVVSKICYEMTSPAPRAMPPRAGKLPKLQEPRIADFEPAKQLSWTARPLIVTRPFTARRGPIARQRRMQRSDPFLSRLGRMRGTLRSWSHYLEGGGGRSWAVHLLMWLQSGRSFRSCRRMHPSRCRTRFRGFPRVSEPSSAKVWGSPNKTLFERSGACRGAAGVRIRALQALLGRICSARGAFL